MAANPESIADAKGPQRAPGMGRRRAGRQPEPNGNTRFFLGSRSSADTAAPILDKEFTTENEAMLESLRTGLTYFAVSEFRAAADLSGKIPQIRREGVNGSHDAGSKH